MVFVPFICRLWLFNHLCIIGPNVWSFLCCFGIGLFVACILLRIFVSVFNQRFRCVVLFVCDVFAYFLYQNNAALINILAVIHPIYYVWNNNKYIFWNNNIFWKLLVLVLYIFFFFRIRLKKSHHSGLSPWWKNFKLIVLISAPIFCFLRIYLDCLYFLDLILINDMNQEIHPCLWGFPAY